MALRPIDAGQSKDPNRKLKNVNNPNFTGGFNPINVTMDAINSGGYIASFFAQDCLGTIIPRIYEGANRNRDKTGEYNWAFARREALREILSGPCMFIIPAAAFAFLKKKGGESHKVPVDRIHAYGGHFAEFAKDNKELITKNPQLAREQFYYKIFEDMLNQSVDGKLPQDEVQRLSKDYAKRFIEAENSKSQGLFRNIAGKRKSGSKEEIIGKMFNEFSLLRKQHLDPSAGTGIATVVSGEAKATGGFKDMLSSLTDFTDDIMKRSKNAIEKSGEIDVTRYVKDFTRRRMGSRILANFGIFGATVAFMTQVPKLYNMGQKENPGLAGLDVPGESNDGEKTQPNFTGKANILEKTANTVTKNKWLKNLSDKFEFNGASMTPAQCLTLLFGFCLPPRIMNAQDKHDRKEILVRDISSFIAILFAARGLARVFSRMMSKMSGFALNIKPENYNNSRFRKIYSYVTSGTGIHVLKTEELVSKYSQIDKYKDGINGFFKFIESNDGDIKKVLRFNKTVRTNTEKILGKPLKNATNEEIKNAFKTLNPENENLQNIVKVFEKPNNIYVNRAKMYNNAFDFLSTLVIVPSFMIWLAKYCERMTKRDIENERQKNEASETTNMVTGNLTRHQIRTLATSKPTMEGFLGRN